MTDLISESKARKGTNSAQAFSHSFTIAGYRASHASLNSANRSSAAASVGAVYTRRKFPCDRRPVLARGVPKRVAQQMDHTRLGNRQRPRGADSIGQTGQP